MAIEMEIVNPEALYLDVDTDERQKLAQMIARRILSKYLPETKSAGNSEPPAAGKK